MAPCEDLKRVFSPLGYALFLVLKVLNSFSFVCFDVIGITHSCLPSMKLDMASVNLD